MSELDEEKRGRLFERALVNFGALADEEQEACIHCGDIWYVIHHKDGVCHKCIAAHLPGRREIARSKAHREVVKQVLIALAFMLVLYWTWTRLPIPFISH